MARATRERPPRSAAPDTSTEASEPTAPAPASRAPRETAKSRSEVRLQWPGRDVPREPPGAALRVVERSSTVPDVRLVRADAWTLARALDAEGLAGKVDLVYLDPPFFSDADYTHEARLDGTADGRKTRVLAYEDTWAKKTGGLGSYLDMLAPRLEALARLVGKRGTFWVHLDWRASYLVRVLLDEIFGKDAFLNEIVWKRAPNLGRQAASGQFGRTLDTLIVYGGKDAELVPPKRPEEIPSSGVRFDEEGRPFTAAPRGDYTDLSIARLESEGRVLRTASGKVYIKYFLIRDEDGRFFRERPVDALWTDIPPLRHAAATERTGYPTQKPVALLERVVMSGSPERGLVVDAFAGSGTTGEAAFRTKRRAVLGDAGPIAIATARARLLRAGASVELSESNEATPTAPLEISVRTERVGRHETRVVLETPVEPLAWAVDPGKGALVPFEAVWSATRGAGKKPVPAATEVMLPGAHTRLSVRVYADDGRVGTIDVEVSPK